jgi:hypothetical protein
MTTSSSQKKLKSDFKEILIHIQTFLVNLKFDGMSKLFPFYKLKINKLKKCISIDAELFKTKAFNTAK